ILRAVAVDVVELAYGHVGRGRTRHLEVVGLAPGITKSEGATALERSIVLSYRRQPHFVFPTRIGCVAERNQLNREGPVSGIERSVIVFAAWTNRPRKLAVYDLHLPAQD